MTPSHIYVIINRTTGFIYGTTFDVERAQFEVKEAKKYRDALGSPDDVIVISHEPILPQL
jgi:hypothetical protein